MILKQRWSVPDEVQTLVELPCFCSRRSWRICCRQRTEVPVISADAEEVDLQDFDNSQGSSGGHRREAYNDSSDEEGGPQGPGVQCAHQ